MQQLYWWHIFYAGAAHNVDKVSYPYIVSNWIELTAFAPRDLSQSVVYHYMDKAC